MSQIITPAAARTAPAASGYRVDPFRGERVGRVSSEWFSRPADQRFLSLSDLHRSVKARADRSRARTLESRDVRVEARRDDGDRLSLILPGEPEPVAPTHWSFGQLASLVGAPAGYLRQLPAAVAGINLQYGLSHRGGSSRRPCRSAPRCRPSTTGCGRRPTRSRPTMPRPRTCRRRPTGP